MDNPVDVGGFSWQEISPPFSGAKGRVKRAEHHLAELHGAASKLLDDLDDRIRIAKLPNGDLNIGLAKAPEPHLEIPILIGEIVYNVRSALDSLVYDLAVFGKRAPTRASGKTLREHSSPSRTPRKCSRLGSPGRSAKEAWRSTSSGFRSRQGGQQKVDMELSLGIYLRPWKVPLPETLQEIHREASAFIEEFGVEPVSGSAT